MTLPDDGSRPSLPSGPTLQDNYWSQLRKELSSWLNRNASSLGELYDGAVVLMEENRLPGRVRFVCHAVREIRNRLPDVMSGSKSTERLDYVNRLDALAKTWTKEGFGFSGITVGPSFSNDSGNTEPVNDVRVPRPLFARVAKLLGDHVTARERPSAKAARLFQGCVRETSGTFNPLQPIIRQWLQVTDWFMQRTHDSGSVDADCSVAEFREKFNLFEATLASLVRQFYNTTKELDEILEDANS